MELQIRHFGQTPSQLLLEPHPARLPLEVSGATGALFFVSGDGPVPSSVRALRHLSCSLVSIIPTTFASGDWLSRCGDSTRCEGELPTYVLIGLHTWNQAFEANGGKRSEYTRRCRLYGDNSVARVLMLDAPSALCATPAGVRATTVQLQV